MKTRTKKIYLGVTHSGVEHSSNGEGAYFVKSARPAVGYIQEDIIDNGTAKPITCSNLFNRTIYGYK